MRQNLFMHFALHDIRLLYRTSRTFWKPIMQLPQELRQVVGSAYLCMRAIDEIEDHPEMEPQDKINLLVAVAHHFQSGTRESGQVSEQHLQRLFSPYDHLLPRVTLTLGRSALLAPQNIAEKIQATTAAMAGRMARWVRHKFAVNTEADLDGYCFDVAGRVGLLLNDIWQWHNPDCFVDEPNPDHTIGFGRGLQSVNILRNRKDDLKRGVDLWPANWAEQDLMRYIRRNLNMAQAYVENLRPGPAHNFSAKPLALARGTVDALERGREKLSRGEVKQLIAACQG